jgi:hypothetical protein
MARMLVTLGVVVGVGHAFGNSVGMVSDDDRPATTTVWLSS